MAEIDIHKLVQILPEERQIAWQQLEFTAFLHYGMNTFTNSEWGSGKESPSLYNPACLNTDQWCESLKAAGIKACILTAKHHDGFCLWNTSFTNHSVMFSPKPVDVVKCLAVSCTQYGLKLGLYLSPWDRHEASYGSGKPYDDFFCGQLEELLTRYGQLYSLWFDGACGEGPNGKRQIYDWDRYYRLIRRHQNGAVIAVSGPDVRWIGNEAGITRPSEWSVVPARMRDTGKIAEDSQKADNTSFRERPLKWEDEDLGSREALKGENDLAWYPAEVDVSIRPGWFYHPAENDKIKPVNTLLNIYEKSVGGNAVLLLNIPPDTDGRIHSNDCCRLGELGKAICSIYSVNVLKDGASVCADSAVPSNPAINVLNEDARYWQPTTEKAELIINLTRKTRITHLVLQEEIRQSQRIEAFSLYANHENSDIGNGWQKIYSGTTIGFKKICRFEPVECSALRIIIEESRVFPTLRFVAAYMENF
jgi:alpha-L-fucosidase